MVKRWAFSLGMAAVVAVALAAAVPTPFWIIAPGSAVDLSRHVIVEGHAPAGDRFYLTDVTVTRASVLTLAAGIVPGMRVVRKEMVLPEGQSQHQYERLLMASMQQSQNVAAFVAERAAGLRVPVPVEDVIIRQIASGSPAANVLSTGDVVLTVAGRRVRASSDVARIVGGFAPTTKLPVVVRRGTSIVRLLVPTIATERGTRFGIHLATAMHRPDLPVGVRYSIGNIAGSSGGLMFALQIYGALRADARIRGERIAGTGVLAPDGSIGPIEGAFPKVIAAKRVGARLFLVPRQNYADVAEISGIKVIPVGSFNEARRVLDNARNAKGIFAAARRDGSS